MDDIIELRKQAEALGVKMDRRWKEDRLREEIVKATPANPVRAEARMTPLVDPLAPVTAVSLVVPDVDAPAAALAASADAPRQDEAQADQALAVDVDPAARQANENPWPPESLLFTVPIPEYIHAVPIGSISTMPADIRLAIQGRLGCLFTLGENGAMRAQDGRALRLVVGEGACEIHGAPVPEPEAVAS